MTRVAELTQELHIAQQKGDKSGIYAAYLNLGDYFYDEENFFRARFFFEKAKHFTTCFEELNLKIAVSYLGEGKLWHGARFLKEVLKENPKNFYAKSLLEHVKIKSNFPLVTLTIFLINILVFLLFSDSSTFLSLRFGFSDYFFDFYHLVFSIFYHNTLLHLVLNSIFLVMVGLIVEKKIGSFYFAIVYVFSGMVGNFLEIFLGTATIVFGASSAVFGLLGALVMREPFLKVYLLGVIRMPIILLFGKLFVILEILSGLFPSFFSGMGNFAHLFGFICGMFLIGSFFKYTIPVFYVWFFVLMGFWITSLGFKKFFEIFGFFDYVVAFCLFILGLAIAIISYEYLRTFKFIDSSEFVCELSQLKGQFKGSSIISGKGSSK